MKRVLFSRTVGMKEWLCPNFNHLNRSRVSAINGWKVQCRDSHCQRVYIVGEAFYGCFRRRVLVTRRKDVL
jgi:hypothetical protein